MDEHWLTYESFRTHLGLTEYIIYSIILHDSIFEQDYCNNFTITLGDGLGTILGLSLPASCQQKTLGAKSIWYGYLVALPSHESLG